MRFDARHVGSGLWGIFDAGVMGWRVTDLAEHEAHQQAADLNVTLISTANATKPIAQKSIRRLRCNRPRGQRRASSTGG